jgi:glutamyl-tRNA reductase
MHFLKPLPVCVIGISHHTAPVAIREAVALDSQDTMAILQHLQAEYNSCGFVLSTCNRTELYCTQLNELQIQAVQLWLNARKQVQHFTNVQQVYVHQGMQAVEHLFKVISGLDSQILGEYQIIGQVKNAFAQAQCGHFTDSFLHKLFDTALQTQKNVRTKTTLNEGAVSISYAGVELAKKIFDNLSNKTVAIVGAGETAELAARHFKEKGVKSFLFFNRTQEHATQLAHSIDTQALSYGLDSLAEHICHADILISATSGTSIIVHASMVEQALKNRKHKPLFLIDLAVPRDIDADCQALEQVYLYNLDDLQMVIQENLQRRQAELPAAIAFIEEGVHSFAQWYAHHEYSDLFRTMQEYYDMLQASEVERYSSKLDDAQKETLLQVTNSLCNKILHRHFALLKDTSLTMEQRAQLQEWEQQLHYIKDRE